MNVSPRYDVGSPTLRDIWVDSAGGDDSRDGSCRAASLRTVAAAWVKIPAQVDSAGHGWRILLAPGVHEPQRKGHIRLRNRHGTAACPIVLQPADGALSAELPPINVRNCRHVYLLDLKITGAGNPLVGAHDDMLLHLADCRDVLVRGVTAVGHESPAGLLPSVTLKANQCLRMYVEDCDLSGAEENAIDYVAVQYGHIVGCRLHRAKCECMYVKGGSGHLLIAGNEMFDSVNHGVLAGQCTGFQYMVAPWLHYEAYDVKIVNNVIRDAGSGLAVCGGYNILIAWNTCYRVGSSRDTILVGLGGRGWVGPKPAIADEHFRLGGWCNPDGPVAYNIPNRNVQICNNVILNPDGYESRIAHFGISGPVATQPGGNLPEPARADEGLRICGNVIWNGPPDKPMLDTGVSYHLAAASQADPAELARLNAINSVCPELVDPESGDFRPVPGGSLCGLSAAEILDFDDAAAPTRPVVPRSDPDNRASQDRHGLPRDPNGPPGAFA